MTYMTIDEVSEYLRVPKSTLYTWRSRNRGPRAAVVGKQLRYRLSDIEKWIESRMSGGDR